MCVYIYIYWILSLSWTVAQSCTFLKYLQYNCLISCTCTLNWDKVKLTWVHSDYFIKPFTQFLLPLEPTDPVCPSILQSMFTSCYISTAAFKHVSHHNLNKHTSFDHICSQKPSSLWPEGRVARGPCSLVVDNQGHFVLGNIRAVTFSLGVPHP